MNVPQISTQQSAFGRKEDIPLVRQAAKNLQGIYTKCKNVGCFSNQKHRKILLLNRKMELRTKAEFDSYVTSLSRKEVKELLYEASSRIKEALKMKVGKIETSKNPKDFSKEERLIVQTAKKYISTPLTSLPKKN